MEGEEIGLVLARASELRTKITDCIGRGGGDELQRGRRAEEDEEERGGEGVEEEEEEEAESLLSIRDALESLEQQLASLQVSISYSLISYFVCCCCCCCLGFSGVWLKSHLEFVSM